MRRPLIVAVACWSTVAAAKPKPELRGATSLASDSAGEIFATKAGRLKIITAKDGKAYWIKGGQKTELTVVEPVDNRYLIYRELGIYGQLGTVCDDL